MKTDIETQQLKNIEQRLLVLEEEKADLLRQKRVILQNSLTDKASSKQNTLKIVEQKLSTEQKVELYFQLFKDRQDIYATRWENKKGRSGYSVACSNEWKPNICHKPKIKCVDCSNRVFKPLNKQIIY